MTASPVTPTLPEYFDAAFQASLDGTINSGITPLMSDGKPVEQFINADGFGAIAFVTPDKQLIIAYTGTDIKQLLTNPGFVIPQIEADYEIYQGKNPKAYQDGLAFAATAMQAAALNGVSTSPGNVFIDGHSLGGAIAAYVSAQTGLPGTTFAAPGLAPGDIPAHPENTPTAYVEYGDPIGNFGNNPNLEGSFLQNDGILRFGNTQYIGNFVDQIGLAASALIYDNDKDAGLLAFALGAIEHHPLTDYASSLGIASPSTTGTGPYPTPMQLVQAFEQAEAAVGDGTTQVASVGSGAYNSVSQVQNTDGAVSTTLTGGSHFAGKRYFAYTSKVGPDQNLQATTRSLNSGAHRVSIYEGGQTLNSEYYDTFNNGAAPNNTFVFDPGHGVDVVNLFRVNGTDHDTLSFLGSDFGNDVANVLAHTRNVQGGVVINDPTTQDKVFLSGLHKGQLARNSGDFSFHT